MKIKIQFTIDIDPHKVRAEYCDDSITSADMRAMFTEDARQSVQGYIEKIGVAKTARHMN